MKNCRKTGSFSYLEVTAFISFSVSEERIPDKLYEKSPKKPKKGRRKDRIGRDPADVRISGASTTFCALCVIFTQKVVDMVSITYYNNGVI